MEIIKRHWGLIAVFVLSLFSILPLFQPGFFPMHDDTQVARVFEMGKALKDGMFPVRWVPDLGYGYGYPIFNFYAPLAYYVGGLFTILGFDALIATKIMMIVGIVLSGVFMYLLAREFWGEMGGVLSGLFYVYAPYHAVDIYVRGDVAEFWGYAFIPLMFWGIYKVFDSPRRSPSGRTVWCIPSATFEVNSVWRWVIIGSLGYAGVILSHNLTAIMATPFLIIVTLLYCYIAYRNKKLSTIYYLLFTILLGLALSAFYWVPALLEMKYTNVLSQIGGGADFRDHFVCLGQLWESNWGFGGSTAGCMLDGMSFVIGKLHIVVPFVVLALVLLFLIKDKNYIVAFLSFAGFALSIFFTLEISRFVWETFPTMAFFQYPWRFLILASFFSSLLSGAIIWFLTIHLRGVASPGTVRYLASQHLEGGRRDAPDGASRRTPSRWILMGSFGALIFLLIFFNSKLFQPQTIVPRTASDYTNEYALKWTASKISDEFLPPNFKKPKSEHEIAERPIEFRHTNVQKGSNLISFIGILVLIAGIIYLRLKRPINE